MPFRRQQKEEVQQDRVFELNDRTVGQNYPLNTIRTTRYTPLTFFPKNILEQHRKLSNIFFLFTMVVNLLPWFNIYNPVMSILPYAFILGVTMVKDAFEDIKRHRNDSKVNSQLVMAYRDSKFVHIKTKDLQVGDYIILESNTEVPADCILLSTSNEFGVAYINTMNLDGETSIKIKQSHPVILDKLGLVIGPDVLLRDQTTSNHFYGTETKGIQLGDTMSKWKATVRTCPPNRHLSNFTATIDFVEETQIRTVSFGEPHFLLKGSFIKTTNYSLGLVVYTGPETKIRLNTEKPTSKTTALQLSMNRVLMMIVLALMVLIVLSSTLSHMMKFRVKTHPYLFLHEPHFFSFFVDFISFIVYYNYAIPMSLFVTVEVGHAVQTVFLQMDEKMIEPADPKNPDDGEKKGTIVRSSELTDELGVIDHIFTDKTGTLTANEMIFKLCTIGTEKYKLGDLSASLTDNLHHLEDGAAQATLSDTKPFEDAVTVFTDCSNQESTQAVRPSSPPQLLHGTGSVAFSPSFSVSTPPHPQNLSKKSVGSVSQSSLSPTVPTHVTDTPTRPISHSTWLIPTSHTMNLPTDSPVPDTQISPFAPPFAPVSSLPAYPALPTPSPHPSVQAPPPTYLAITTNTSIPATPPSRTPLNTNLPGSPEYNIVHFINCLLYCHDAQSDVTTKREGIKPKHGFNLSALFSSFTRIRRTSFLSRSRRSATSSISPAPSHEHEQRSHSQDPGSDSEPNETDPHTPKEKQRPRLSFSRGRGRGSDNSIASGLPTSPTGEPKDGESVATAQAQNTPKEIEYQSTSPDEIALLTALNKFGVTFRARTPNMIKAEVDGQPIPVVVLAVLPFSSERKRMSVVVRLSDGSIRLYTKGADVACVPLCQTDSVHVKKEMERVRQQLAVLNAGEEESGGDTIGDRAMEGIEQYKLMSNHLNPSINDPLVSNARADIRNLFKTIKEEDEKDYTDEQISLTTLEQTPSGTPHTPPTIPIPLESPQLSQSALKQRLEILGKQLRTHNAVCEAVDEYSRLGLRTLCICTRQLSESEFEMWESEFDMAQRALRNRSEKEAECFDKLEHGMELVGCTGVEDRLQDDCANTIEFLKEAGLKVWVLTGDKQNTAVTIGFASKLLSKRSQPVYVTSNSIVREYREKKMRERTKANLLGGMNTSFVLMQRNKNMVQKLRSSTNSPLFQDPLGDEEEDKFVQPTPKPSPITTINPSNSFPLLPGLTSPLYGFSVNQSNPNLSGMNSQSMHDPLPTAQHKSRHSFSSRNRHNKYVQLKLPDMSRSPEGKKEDQMLGKRVLGHQRVVFNSKTQTLIGTNPSQPHPTMPSVSKKTDRKRDEKRIAVDALLLADQQTEYEKAQPKRTAGSEDDEAPEGLVLDENKLFPGQTQQRKKEKPVFSRTRSTREVQAEIKKEEKNQTEDQLVLLTLVEQMLVRELRKQNVSDQEMARAANGQGLTTPKNKKRQTNKLNESSVLMSTQTLTGQTRDLQYGTMDQSLQEERRKAIVVDGFAINAILHSVKLQGLFIKLASLSEAVICCRISPIQKALIVRMVKDNCASKCLAIGDGANDVSMITEAHVGVGIIGKEGTQASQSSDFALPSFRHLKRLLCVHGYHNLRRTTVTIEYSFYKNIVFVTVLLLYNFFSQHSQQPPLGTTFPTLFNVVYTSLPIFVMCCVDKEVNDRVLEKYAMLYEEGKTKNQLRTKRFIPWVLLAVYQGFISLVFTLLFVSHNGLFLGGQPTSVEHSETLMQFVVFSLVTCVCVWCTRSGSILVLITTAVTILVFYVIVFLSTTVPFFTDVPGVFYQVLSSPNTYLCVVLTLGAGMVPLMAVNAYQHFFSRSHVYQINTIPPFNRCITSF
ncbi:phospholipid-transporting P-type ATPase [Blattamonas nauphoetae]|uniref:Phospholipid-transporting P-type ATPase n=1 Tax=Blattamonas nauphoetae TaxID=2049346 RepID=A0ABQ9XLY9_9EUKA|nr:phospholipid-transporting P-type ATPase [Blattamonas nauphoetae]